MFKTLKYTARFEKKLYRPFGIKYRKEYTDRLVPKGGYTEQYKIPRGMILPPKYFPGNFKKVYIPIRIK